MTKPYVSVCLTILIHLVLFQTAFAAGASKVTLKLPQDSSINAGQRFSFSVNLLTSFQFAGATYFDLPKIDGAVIMQVSERPIFGNEQINNESYVSASYDFAVFAQRGGRLTIPPITARFGSKPAYNQPVVEHKLQTQSFEIQVIAPPGAAAGELIISSNELTVKESWSSKLEKIKVGDAITRTVSISAQEVPAMLLPPPNFSNVKGLSLYPKSPQLNDKTARGVFIGERVDTVTYIFEQAGSIKIPALSLRWWDPSLDQWQSKSFPEVKLKVAKNPALATQFTGSAGVSETAIDIRSWTGWIALMMLLIVGGLLSVRLYKEKFIAWRKQRAASETAQWKRLRHVCNQGGAAEVYREFNRWLSHYGMSSAQLTVGVTLGVSDALRSSCLALQQQLAGLDTQWSARTFSHEVNKLRQDLQMSNNIKTARALPPLNPM